MCIFIFIPAHGYECKRVNLLLKFCNISNGFCLEHHFLYTVCVWGVVSDLCFNCVLLCQIC